MLIEININFLPLAVIIIGQSLDNILKLSNPDDFTESLERVFLHPFKLYESREKYKDSPFWNIQEIKFHVVRQH